MDNNKIEAEKKECEAQLELVIASLRDDAGNTELLKLKSELDEMVALYNEILGSSSASAETQPAAPAPAPAATKQTQAEGGEPKWSRENHPAFKKTGGVEEEKEEVVYKVNDTVMAKWVSGDKGFYPARITSITGSSTAPIYTVKFKSYDTVETLRGKDIRSVGGGGSGGLGSGGQGVKRKADGGGGPVTTTTTHTPVVVVGGEGGNHKNNGIVMSAGAELYPNAQQLGSDNKKEKESKLDDMGRPKFKKIKATKELEAGKNKWQEFNAKGKGGKGVKKDSMFRTPEGVKGRVGFTGSGQAMRKDPTRSRHVYQPNEDLD
ncbi:splicing factor spf30 [Echria macrotheca]|uniref:Splicing factor spf30 n=1 Tax=Echria macrotheca TaxID=438768 RepID=A0AAJ0BJY6_9PEZI|nr:splicing factor spf30 [Echria macrotheca]